MCSAKEFIESDESESTSEKLSDDDIVRMVKSNDAIEEEIQTETQVEKIPFDKAFEGFKMFCKYLENSSSFNDKDFENLSYFKNRVIFFKDTVLTQTKLDNFIQNES